MANRLKTITLWGGVLIVITFALLFYEADLLWKVQQHNAFLFSSLFFKQMMVVPGGLLSWLGSFFTQFFYYPWLGTIILCAWWWLLMWLTKRAFNLPEKWNVLTVIPVAILIIANMDLGYWVYLMKHPGYFYVPTLGVTAGAALLWGFRKTLDSSSETSDLRPRMRLWACVAYIVLTAIVCYPFMGIYALASIVLMGVMTWRLKPQTSNITQRIVLTVVALLSVVAVPLIYYRFVYHETNLIYIYTTALPSFSIREDYPDYYVPYYALAVFFLLLALFCRHSPLTIDHSPLTMNPAGENASTPKAKKKGEEQVKQTRTPALLNWTLQGCILAATAFCVYHFWYKDANFHHELRMQRCVEQTDWEGVIEEGKKQDCEPTRAIVMMHNLALSRLGRQCSEMYKFPKGSSKPNTPLPVYMYHVAGRMMLYQYGMTNECHRVCMEEGVETGWSVEMLQYLARCAIINKETQVARKFLDLLRQTLFYGQWADHAEQLLNDPKKLAGDSETGPITHMLHYSDRLEAVEGYVEKFLMTTLAQHDANDIYFQEQAVLGALWTREPSFFWPRIEHYMELSDGYAPRIFQEAIWLFGNLEGVEGMDEWTLEPGVKESFQAFMQMMQQYKKSPNNVIRNTIMARFGNTYYFEYFFLRNITYY